MKKILLAAVLPGIIAAQGANAESITLEFMWGIGKSAEKSEGTSSKYCKNRTWPGMKGIAFRYYKDGVEAHVARYNHDESATNCDRSNWAVGIGGLATTLDDDKQEDIYANAGLGLAYRFKETWRDQSHFGLYGRGDVGVSVYDNDSGQLNVQGGFIQYGGWFEPNHGERFLTLGGNWSKLNDSSSGVTFNNTSGTSGTGGSGGDGGSGGSGGDSGSNTNYDSTNSNNSGSGSDNNTNYDGDSNASSSSGSSSSTSGADSTSETETTIINNITNVVNVTESTSGTDSGDGGSGGDGGDGGSGGDGGDGGSGGDVKCHHVHGCNNFPPGLGLGLRKK